MVRLLDRVFYKIWSSIRFTDGVPMVRCCYSPPGRSNPDAAVNPRLGCLASMQNIIIRHPLHLHCQSNAEIQSHSHPIGSIASFVLGCKTNLLYLCVTVLYVWQAFHSSAFYPAYCNPTFNPPVYSRHNLTSLFCLTSITSLSFKDIPLSFPTSK